MSKNSANVYKVDQRLPVIPFVISTPRLLTTVLSVHPTTNLMFSVFSADNTLNTKFESMCANTSSSLGIITSFLDIPDLLTNNPLFVILGW